MISFLAAAVAALAAAVGTGLLARDCARLPRIELAGWLVAAAGLTLALAAQALGYSGGFDGSTFRGVQLGAQLLAPLALVWGLAEVVGRSVAARFAARLVLAAVTVIASVIMATDPLSSDPFSKAWPSASVHYQIIPKGVLALIAAGTVLAAVAAVAVAGVRSRQEPAWQEAFQVAAAGGAAVVVIQLLRLTLPLNAAYPAVCLLTAGLAWFAGTRSDVHRLGLRGAPAGGRGGYQDDDGYGGLYRQDSGGYRHRDDTGWGQPGADTGYGSYGTDHGGRDISDSGYGFYRDDTGGLRAVSDTGYGLYRDDTGGMVFSDGPGAGGALGAADALPGLAGFAGAGAEDEEEGTARLYGQIAIYTLLEGRAEDFDQLAQDIVAKVKAREPETLVFVMHGVPSAPMQRILYEVYRDQAAYEHHAEQAYIRDFEEQRKPYVLATNVIELGVRQAKVLPLAPGGLGNPGAAPAAAPVRSRSADPPPRSRSAESPARSRPADPLPRSRPADPLPRSRPPEPPARSRSAESPSRSRPADPPETSRSRSQAAPDRSRSRGPSGRRPAPADGDFWTRGPADPKAPDDGEFWGPHQ